MHSTPLFLSNYLFFLLFFLFLKFYFSISREGRYKKNRMKENMGERNGESQNFCEGTDTDTASLSTSYRSVCDPWCCDAHHEPL